jgi:tRNA uridine 5-carboxymethylaminomethyl modification enzyme
MKPFQRPDVIWKGDVRPQGSRAEQTEILHYVQDDRLDPLATFDVESGSWSPAHEAYQVWVQHKYHGYLDRQMGEIARFQKAEFKKLPDGFDFAGVPGLLLEAREKLRRIRPSSLGQASRIPGVTPADISILMVFLKKEGALRG